MNRPKRISAGQYAVYANGQEIILRRLGPVDGVGGTRHVITADAVTIHPFSLRDKPSYDLAIDRLAYWYYHPREWLKKVALMDGVYLLNSPFTFQSMEKHAAYCAMMRLGLSVPETVLVPYKNPVDNDRYAGTAAQYNQPFDLPAIGRSAARFSQHVRERLLRKLGRLIKSPRRVVERVARGVIHRKPQMQFCSFGGRLVLLRLPMNGNEVAVGRDGLRIVRIVFHFFTVSRRRSIVERFFSF